MEIPGRQRCLRSVIDSLAATRVGRDLGAGDVRTLDDLRTLIPVMDRQTHQDDVESRLGFGAEASDADPDDAAIERDMVVGVWRWYLDDREPRRVALLRGEHADPISDTTMVDDLQALGGELLRISEIVDPAEVVERLARFDPEVLVVPSGLTCRFLERAIRGPLERRLPELRLILAEHDLEHRLRSRVPIRSAGWIDRSGRCGLASAREPRHAVTLAVGTHILELLPYTNPEQDGRRVYAEQTVLPEHAIVGMRYELVVTSPLGFLRARTDEHVRVVGFDAPSSSAPFPRPRVVRLAPAPADVRLEGCTVAGAWLTASIRQALWREDPALVGAEIGPDPLSSPGDPGPAQSASMRLPDSFKETELAWMARTGAHRLQGRRPRGLLVRIELQGHVGRELPGRLAERIDQNLRRRSAAYAYLRERDDLDPPRVTVLRSGTGLAQQRRRITELLGRGWVPEVRVIAD